MPARLVPLAARVSCCMPAKLVALAGRVNGCKLAKLATLVGRGSPCVLDRLVLDMAPTLLLLRRDSLRPFLESLTWERRGSYTLPELSPFGLLGQGFEPLEDCVFTRVLLDVTL